MHRGQGHFAQYRINTLTGHFSKSSRMHLSCAASLSVLLALLVVTSSTATDDSSFNVETTVLDESRVRLSWETWKGDGEGKLASRYRILCSSKDSPSLEAISTKPVVEIDGFVKGETYECEVHPVWKDLIEGMDMMEAVPGRSDPFIVELHPGESTAGAEAEATTSPTPDAKLETVTTDATEASVPEVTAAPIVRAETLSEQSARISWEPVLEKGVPATRYRVVCLSENPGNKKNITIASTQNTAVEIETLEPQREYTCSVYGVWDNLAPGMEVVSVKPGISNSFVPFGSDGYHVVLSPTFMILTAAFILQVNF